eukprot:CAMPEP_0171503484 /NCGR_PEP_ID=MMETSP0958-20121227/10918_1 /TAXON_ID=87120 /ORGANISM="Aurantiochytrium limacinum, Strain ATCCMYA-1381" /LENGTH=522 /DNA_ID=CAMNT_0012038973 /DNA_START=147 /DNA_END=1715 /DNA_ORIENTATION=+
MSESAAAHERGMQGAASQQIDGADVDRFEREYSVVLQEVRQGFASGKTKSAAWRINQLKQLKRCMSENKDEIASSMKQDLGRCKFESLFGEALACVFEIDHLISNLESWMAPERVWHPITVQPGYSEVRREPKGVVLILSPWNYPINLSIMCIAAAIAAGNAFVIKPSEVAPATGRFVEMMVNKYLDSDVCRVVMGAVPETTALLRLRWDHIIYTGNGAVARIVMTAAAKHLTPITLELGGKSPAIVDSSCSLTTSARRILVNKFMNCGQTCVAPDYVLVSREFADKLVAELKKIVHEFYGEDPSTQESLGRIVNERHHDRVMRLLDPSSHGGEVLLGGTSTADRASKYIPPTLILNPRLDSPLMTEEIFGPVLPIVTLDKIDDAIDFVQAREHPLALYVFAENNAFIEKVAANTQAGGMCINDCIMHLTNPYLPFGGVGSSGMGCYHGKWGFDELSHIKAVMKRSTMLDAPIRYPNNYNGEQVEKILTFMTSEGMSPSTKTALTAAALGTIGFLLLRQSKM